MNHTIRIGFLTFLIGWLAAFLPFSAFAGPDNIAPEASISVSTTLDDAHRASFLTDGVIGVADVGEWACQGETVFWGYVRYPWVQLDWNESKSIDKVILYDRPELDEHIAGGRLLFSDGTRITVTAIPNDGTAKVISFPVKKVDWVRFVVTDGDGANLGLSEIEVFPAPENYPDLVSHVDPFIESAKGRYFFFTPGCRPFGMVATAPHTRNKNQWGGGYNYNSTDILGFGQLHAWMLSGIDIMPTTGAIDPTLGQEGWKSPFSHDDEIAQPGYQRVYLRRYHTWVENTVTDRVSLYRFRFTEDAEANILTSLGGYLGSTTMTEAQVEKVSSTELEGSFVSAGRMWGGPKKIKVFFVIEFDKPFDQLDGWNDQENVSDIQRLKGSDRLTRRDSMTYGDITQSYYDAPGAGVSAKYQVKAGDLLHMKIAVSYTSIDNARKNLKAELDHWDFEQVRNETQNIWGNWLSKIDVKGGTATQRIKFYTDLWHALLGRKIIDDVSGEYPDYTQGERDWKFTSGEMIVRELPKDEQGKVAYHMYGSDALWLTQWNLNILWGLGWPGVLDDFTASMIQYADNGGLLPRGPCVGAYSWIMTGCPASSMIASAYQKDLLRKRDPLHALEAMKRNHLPGGMMGEPEDVAFYMKNGYCPGNAGETLEWAFQDWALSEMAGKLGRKKDQRVFAKRAEGWRALYRPENQLVFPKTASGEWLHDDPLNGQGWIEANAWQGTWSISHDIAALADLQGGDEILCEKLNFAFEQAADDDFVFGYGSGYVSYANQPGCSNAHVFNHAGKPWLSQYWVRRVNAQAYGGTTPDEGYGGHDEDEGQMGGVSALMSLGIFSLRGNAAADPIYEITSPVFDEITIRLDPTYYSGKEFVIRTHDNSAEHMYIQRATLNGDPLNNCWIRHADFAAGGTLELWMGPEPNTEWGVAEIPGR